MSENGAVTDASCLYNYAKNFSGDAMLVVISCFHFLCYFFVSIFKQQFKIYDHYLKH